MSFSFSFVAKKKRKKRTKRKRKHAIVFYALTSVVQIDVASRACTLSLAIAAKRCTLAARLSFVIYIQGEKFFTIFVTIS